MNCPERHKLKPQHKIFNFTTQRREKEINAKRRILIFSIVEMASSAQRNADRQLTSYFCLHVTFYSEGLTRRLTFGKGRVCKLQGILF